MLAGADGSEGRLQARGGGLVSLLKARFSPGGSFSEEKLRAEGRLLSLIPEGCSHPVHEGTESRKVFAQVLQLCCGRP